MTRPWKEAWPQTSVKWPPWTAASVRPAAGHLTAPLCDLSWTLCRRCLCFPTQTRRLRLEGSRDLPQIQTTGFASTPRGDVPPRSPRPGAPGGLRREAPQPRCRPQVGEARALYNMGNVYHAKGKQLCWHAAQDPGHLPPDVRDALRRASEFYE